MNIFEGAFDNIFGGHDYHDENGVYYGHSEYNGHGGYNYYDEHNHMVAHIEDNHIGGMAIYDDTGFEGNFFHAGSFELFNEFGGGVHHYEHFASGNIGDMMNYDDPLAHISNYIMPDLIF